MDRPCCIGVARDASSLVGKECSVMEPSPDGRGSPSSSPAYVSSPTVDGPRKKIGVLVIHDIWGWRIPNSKYIADYLSSNGFVAMCPNLYHGISTLDGWPGTEFDDGEPLDGAKWDNWWAEITSENYWKGFNARVEAATAVLKNEHDCTSLCVIGFCWGGLALEQLSIKKMFVQAASCHGCHETADNFKAAKAAGCEIVYHTVPGDESFTADTQGLLKAAGASVTVYDGMEHGFVVRGDFKGNAALKKAADDCLASVVAQFDKAA